MDIRIIKTDEQYRKALAEVGRLAEKDPVLESPDGTRLELLAKLVDDYERDRFLFNKPDPVDAIIFRMEEKGLRQKDIAGLLGGRNRASEILSRKRSLTLPMIRALHEKLDIPPALLVREPAVEYKAEAEFDEADIPLDVLQRRGWIEAGVTAKQLVHRLLAPSTSPVLLRHTRIFGGNARTNHVRIQLWLARVREIAESRHYLRGRYQKDCLNLVVLRYIARLSWMEDGPRLAMNFLAERGIALVVEPHLSPTRLDGAAMIGRNGAPVIGMTIREDRLDNFWFTLMHELVHAWKHLDDISCRAIADENIEKPDADVEEIEREANELAAEILIDKATWRRSHAHLNPSTPTIQEFANRMQVSSAVVAGRIRYERRNYSLFSRLVGYRTVRAMFPEVKWS
ncbi:MAG: ImmA/IrrE family metallo-endopeptidase [Dokdonella sp.]